LSGDPITSTMALPLEIRFTELVIRPYPGRSVSDCPASARRRSNASLFAASTVRYPESRSCAVHAQPNVSGTITRGGRRDLRT
jgi:hypothetical protein